MSGFTNEMRKVVATRNSKLLQYIKCNPNATYVDLSATFLVCRQQIRRIAKKAGLPPRKPGRPLGK